MGWTTNIVTAWISSALTPSQNDPIPSLNLVMHMNGLEIISVSHTLLHVWGTWNSCDTIIHGNTYHIFSRKWFYTKEGLLKDFSFFFVEQHEEGLHQTLFWYPSGYGLLYYGFQYLQRKCSSLDELMCENPTYSNKVILWLGSSDRKREVRGSFAVTGNRTVPKDRVHNCMLTFK